MYAKLLYSASMTLSPSTSANGLSNEPLSHPHDRPLVLACSVTTLNMKSSAF